MIEKNGELRRLVMEGESENWWFNEDAGFCRWYAKRSPADDWAEHFSFFLLGIDRKNPDLQKKYDFIEKFLESEAKKQGGTQNAVEND